MQLTKEGRKKGTAAVMSGMSENTARRYRKLNALPSQVRAEHSWATREDPFKEYWPEVQSMLEAHPGLQGTTIFEELKLRYPGQFKNGQLRTLQRRIKHWAATQGPGKPVIFPQVHYPGQLAASDFCHMNCLNVTIAGIPFPHLLYHFVLTYSNWETGQVCFSESFESLCEGLLSALTTLGGVPQRHRTDCLSAAVYRLGKQQCFTPAYQGLLNHYGLTGEHIQSGQAHENGDIEQRHHRLRVALDQALMVRGSRAFGSRQEYEVFLHKQFMRLNSTRHERFREEAACLRELPISPFESCTCLEVRVGPSSTIRVKNNVYSVPSRLIGSKVQVRLRSQEVEVWFGQRLQERMPRLRGNGRHQVNYRHVIDSLVRKPGAFAQYRWHSDMFPSSLFRMAYDSLRASASSQRTADKEYLSILLLAAHDSEQGVQDALRLLLMSEQEISAAKVRSLLDSEPKQTSHVEVAVRPVCLKSYDTLLNWPPTTGSQGPKQDEVTA